MSAEDKLAPPDLKLWKAAVAAVTVAQSTVQFVSNHLVSTYGLDQSSIVDPDTGAITRAVSPAPDPATEPIG